VEHEFLRAIVEEELGMVRIIYARAGFNDWLRWAQHAYGDMWFAQPGGGGPPHCALCNLWTQPRVRVILNSSSFFVFRIVLLVCEEYRYKHRQRKGHLKLNRWGTEAPLPKAANHRGAEPNSLR
jgi:hypothetical protein